MSSENNFGENNDSNSNQDSTLVGNECYTERTDDTTNQILEEMSEGMIYLISNEKAKIAKDKGELLAKKSAFQALCNRKLQEHENNVKNFELRVNKAKAILSDKKIIDLDIGGMIKLSTSYSTLTKYPQSALAVMFSNKYHLNMKDSRVFIDRDSGPFVQLINYLRNGVIPSFNNEQESSLFHEECEYWQIPHEESHQKYSAFTFDQKWCAETLSLDPSQKKITKNNVQHGIIFCTPELSKENPYVEFKILINVASKGKSILYVGVVDKSKYKYTDLLSTFWKDSPSSYYWDVWNTKLIKTDQNGVNIDTMQGYGCRCDDFMMTIGIKYDADCKSISFYKNNYCLGTAFTNVEDKLTPSLDIWFQSGTVEITPNSMPNAKKYL